MSTAEAALTAELLESRRKAEELSALLDAERKRAHEAEKKLQEKEKILQEANRKNIDHELVRKQRDALKQDLAALKQHSQRFSNASGAVDVVIPGLQANAKTVQSQITTHFAKLRSQIQEREDKLHALVESLAEEKLAALKQQKLRMDAIVAECEKAITATEACLEGDDWSLLTSREAVAAQAGRAISNTCKLEAEWSEKIQATLPGTVAEIVESHGVVTLAAIDDFETDWHKDLSVVSRVAEPPRCLTAARPSEGHSDFGFMFDVEARDVSVCVRALHLSSGAGWGPYTYTVYSAPGPWKAIKDKKKRWTQVGKSSAKLPKAKDGQAEIRLNEEGVHIASKQTVCFYVHSADHMTAVAFTHAPRSLEGKLLTQGAIIDEDSHVRILTGAKTCSGDPFASVATDTVRAFAGSLEYLLWCES
mmetsp:Transcript_3397/g.8089  ORF Transcript_3397/g.8089 Transcript_3397/m.8089 type:complete len:421 (+) Transcript_3397:27-1289(+)